MVISLCRAVVRFPFVLWHRLLALAPIVGRHVFLMGDRI